MMKIASGSDRMDYEDWMPSKIHLNIRLMWDILQFDCNHQPQEIFTSSLLHSSVTPAADREDMDESTSLEIIATASPEVTVDTADGGQAVPMQLCKGKALDSSAVDTLDTPGHIALQERLVAPPDNLMFNTTPWLWADPPQFGDVGSISYLDSETNPGGTPFETGGSAWWDLGNL